MNNSKYFPKLDFYQLKRIAYSFKQKYPAIEKLTLYAGVPPNYDYVVLAETVRIDDPKDSDYFAYKQLMNDWSFACSDQDHLCAIVRNAYKEGYKDTEEKWLFLAIWKDQSVSKLSEVFAGSGNAFLIPDYHWDLFVKTSSNEKMLSDQNKTKDDVGTEIKNLKSATGKTKLLPNQSEQIDSILKKFRLSYENDNEIKIQEAGKRAKFFGPDSLGFRDNQTKLWKYFQEILKDPHHIFSLGPSGKKTSTERKTYNAHRSFLIAINKKLIEFFKKEYGLQIPEGYKFYEKYKGSGIYKFKFGFPKESYSPERLEAQYEALTDLELKEKIKDLAKKYKKTYDERCDANLVAATKVAQRKEILSDDQIKAMLEPTKHPEEHIYDPYENVKSIKQKY